MRRLPLSWQIVVWALLVLAVGAVLLPFYFLVINSFKTESEILGGVTFWPRDFTLANYRTLWVNAFEAPLARWFWNSVLVSASVTLLVVIFDSLAAFALTRLRPRGHRLVTLLIIATLFVPVHVVLVPLYLMLEGMGMIDTPLALIFPPVAGAFGVFFLYQFMRNMPGILEDAARIDGCGPWRIYWFVMLPQSRSALAVLAIFTFNTTWNEFLTTLIFTDALMMRTLPVGLAIFQSAYLTHFGITMAASVVTTLPVLVVFLIFQRHIVEGIALTGLK